MSCNSLFIDNHSFKDFNDFKDNSLKFINWDLFLKLGITSSDIEDLKKCKTSECILQILMTKSKVFANIVTNSTGNYAICAKNANTPSPTCWKCIFDLINKEDPELANALNSCVECSHLDFVKNPQCYTSPPTPQPICPPVVCKKCDPCINKNWQILAEMLILLIIMLSIPIGFIIYNCYEK